MTENINNLFEAEEGTKRKVRTLSGTGSLTAKSAELAAEIMTEENMQTLGHLIAGSKTDNKLMEQLLDAVINFDEVDISFLGLIHEVELGHMMKSQQSKRSRLRKKPMTKDNYTQYMNAAISERLIRIALNKPKTGRGLSKDSIVYTDEELQTLQYRQHEVRRELRNVQSKKSMEKRRPEFDLENPSERWEELCIAEQQLKAIRTEIPDEEIDPRVEEVRMAFIASEKRYDKMSKTELLELANRIAEAVNVYAEVYTTEDDGESA